MKHPNHHRYNTLSVQHSDHQCYNTSKRCLFGIQIIINITLHPNTTAILSIRGDHEYTIEQKRTEFLEMKIQIIIVTAHCLSCILIINVTAHPRGVCSALHPNTMAILTIRSACPTFETLRHCNTSEHHESTCYNQYPQLPNYLAALISTADNDATHLAGPWTKHKNTKALSASDSSPESTHKSWR